MEVYYIMRASIRQDGTVSAPVETRYTENEAWGLFYIRAGQAATSENRMETVTLTAGSGFQMDKVSFEHEAVGD